uniref:PLAT domain-containing protein n=1 Tax=Trichobilharzia regenti TaxID=157069 RepID=A0AA85J5E1_TRIRE|nr:unnamed protein product [Trichobilharzia regenti]
MNSLPIKLIPASGSGALTPDLIESIMSHEKEQIYWQVQKWKFKPDTKIVFYSYLTGAPLQIVHSDRINSQLIHGVAGEKGTQAVFNVCHATFVVSPHPKVSKQHSYSQSRWKNSSDEQGCCTFNRDVDYLSFPPVTVTTNGGNSKHKSSTSSDIRNVKYIRSFTSVKNPWLTMCLDETMGLHMTINSSNSQLSRNLVSQCFDFRIRPQSDRLVALESVKCNSLRSRRTHVYVGPDGRIVSGATGPLTIPGKLFMPYVKGCLRDQTILWMCTGVQQTLIPNLVRETNQKDEEDNISNCKFELRATGERISEAYWRVHKVDKCVRRFESIAWPGHFLRVASDVVDAMGGGGMDCYFKINRVRCKGFIQLSPLVDNNKTIGMNEDGTVTLYKKHTMEENCRFYPEVIKYGYPSCQGQLSSAAVTNKNIDFSPHVTSANNGNFSAEKVEQIQDDSRERLVELTQSQCETAANDNDSVRSTVGDDAEPNDDGMSQSQTSDNQNEQKDMRDSSWKLSIFTEKSAENCRIVLVVYGTGGSSGSILIGRSDDNKGLFQTNRIDNFMIILENIGSIYKIRLEVNPINPDVDTVWEVDKVIIENVTTSKQLSFDFSGRPFGKSANFSCLSREQVTSFIHTNNTISLTEKRQSASEIKLCLTNYRVQLELYHDESNECTPSNISLEPYLCLIGQYGDSGRRLLGEVTCEELVNADRKNVWIFDTLIEAAYLGEMTSCFLGPVDVENQPESKCSGLMCNKILVWDTKKQLIYDFPSENWLLPKTNIQAHEVHLTVGQIHSMEAYAEKRWKEIESGKVNQVDNQFEDVTITETKMSNLLQQSEDSIGKENETVTNERNADVKEFSSEKLLGDLNYATEDELKIIRDARLLVSTIIRKSEANLLVFESQGKLIMLTAASNMHNVILLLS